jgi:ketosteroid isomerase-like protein
MRTVRPAEIVRAVLDAVDSRDLDALDSRVADDVYFRCGNTDPSNTKAEFTAAMHSFFGRIGGIRHEVIEVWEVSDGGVIATMDVHYTRIDRPQRFEVLAGAMNDMLSQGIYPTVGAPR